MYVDDIIIYYIEKEVEEIIDLLNLILSDFKVRCCKNYLIVYIGKIVVMFILSYVFVGLLRRFMFRYFYIYFISELYRFLVCYKTICFIIYYVILLEKIFFRIFYLVYMRF